MRAADSCDGLVKKADIISGLGPYVRRALKPWKPKGTRRGAWLLTLENGDKLKVFISSSKYGPSEGIGNHFSITHEFDIHHIDDWKLPVAPASMFMYHLTDEDWSRCLEIDRAVVRKMNPGTSGPTYEDRKFLSRPMTKDDFPTLRVYDREDIDRWGEFIEATLGRDLSGWLDSLRRAGWSG